jgi:hypothetical protein
MPNRTLHTLIARASVSPAKKNGVATLVLGVLLAAASCAAPDPMEREATLAPAAINCREFADALRACAPSSCRQPHPLASGFTIEHRITGLEAAECAYTQSVPGDMAMTCRFSETGRSEMASQMEGMLSGGQRSFSFSFSTSDPPQDTAMTRECILRDHSGAAIPWGVS